MILVTVPTLLQRHSAAAERPTHRIDELALGAAKISDPQQHD
jgi:hypothetical protein